MKKKEKITLLLSGGGLNYLWQLGGIKALYDLGLAKRIDTVYGISGGAWASIFLGLGEEVIDDWLAIAPTFYFEWQKRNKFSYLRRMTTALANDSYKVLHQYGFFTRFKPFFRCYFKLLQLYPHFSTEIINVTHSSPKYVHQLAVASSTVPLITGTIAHVGHNIYVDGGFVRGFRSEQLSPKASRNNIITLSPSINHLFGDIAITPSKPLHSGFKLALPFQVPKKEIQDLSTKGYEEVIGRKNELLEVLCKQTSFSGQYS